MAESAQNRFMTWLKSAPGLVAVATAIVTIVAGIDRGAFVIINVVVTAGMLGLMAMGLALIFNVMNISQFAHGEYFMIGSTVAFYVFTPLSEYMGENPGELLLIFGPFVAIGAATLGGCIAGVLTEKLVFYPLRRRSRENWLMNTFLLTLGLSVILINAHQLLFGPNFKGIVRYWEVPPVEIFGVFVAVDRIVAVVLSVVTMAAFGLFMKFSKLGQAIRAVSQDERGAQMVGINLDAIQIAVMALSCGLAALAGASLLFMYPAYPMVGLGPLYMSWFVMILVGLGNVSGTILGSFIVALLQILTTVYVGEGWGYIVPSVGIVLIMAFRPSGIYGKAVRVSIHDM